MEALKLSGSLEFTPVELKDSDGNIRNYKIMELTAIERERHLTYLKPKLAADGKSLKDYKGVQASFLFRCLVDEDGTPMPKEEIEKLPATTVSALFAEGQMLCGLSDRDDDDGTEKN